MIAVLDTDAALRGLEPEWWALLRRCPVATPFQSPAWLLPWWQEFGTGSPLVATLRRDGALTAMLPMYVLQEDGRAKVLPIGAGTTDYLDALGEPAGPLLPPLLERARQAGADGLDLFDVPPWSALPGAGGLWSPGNPCPVLALDRIPAAIRRKLRMNRNRAARAGGTAVETATAATLPGLLAELVRLHQARWTAQGEAGVLADPRVLRCLSQAAPRLLAAGLLRLQVLRLEGLAVAAILALLAGPRILFYLSGYDAAQAFISPGTLLLGAMLEEAETEGRAEAHFLRGREAYKYAWGAEDRFNLMGRI